MFLVALLHKDNGSTTSYIVLAQWPLTWPEQAPPS